MDNKEIKNDFQSIQEEVVNTPQEQPQIENQNAQIEENMVVELPKEKKLKNDAFNSEEKVLYEIKQEAEGNPLVVVAFIVILIGFVIALPIIAEKTNAFKSENAPLATNPTPAEPEPEQIGHKGFHEDATIDNIRIFNLVTSYINEEYKVSFTLVNEGKEAYTFDKKYYLLLYDEEKLLYRALIHSYEAVASKSAIEMNLAISEKAYNDANKYEIEEITTGRYPSTYLTQKEGEFDVLKCSYLKNQITYYFQDQMLMKIKEEHTDSFDANPRYEETKQNYYKLSNDYNLVNGFTSIFVDNQSDFRLINELDLVTIQNKDLSDLKVYRYFKFRESVDVVAFELGSQGYTCG